MQNKSISKLNIFYLLLGTLYIIIGLFTFSYHLKTIDKLNTTISEIKQKNTELEEQIQNLKNKIKMLDKNKNKIYTIAKVIWCEGKTSKLQIKYVASVVVNRSKSNNLNDLYKVVSAKNQFSCYNKEVLNSQTKSKKDKELLNYTIKLVENIITGNFKPLLNAKYFYNPNLIKNTPKFAINNPLLLDFEGHHYH